MDLRTKAIVIVRKVKERKSVIEGEKIDRGGEERTKRANDLRTEILGVEIVSEKLSRFSIDGCFPTRAHIVPFLSPKEEQYRHLSPEQRRCAAAARLAVPSLPQRKNGGCWDGVPSGRCGQVPTAGGVHGQR